ncbi:carbon-nitrogen hydrolase family protein [Thalassococcus sp. S3]|uniref:carbon-nitrogen hydrolase family protein n=1 Tax=Thalassococcus sp. S3 TaxID=2017482 RepID=UPI001024247F|nr:carbon-nitrogen hydrolase family protein [Thalassococcus sp. S3]QBF34106.1 amidohydrolase [Thalassococcus sp. S3]
MRTALVQLCSSDDPAANLPVTQGLIDEAAHAGAEFVLTPEVTNCVSASRTRQVDVLRHEKDDTTLAALQEQAAKRGIWLLIGSLALKTEDADGRFANRSFLIDPAGRIAARYDKIHMFDVEVSKTETYRESAGYRPGQRAVCAEMPFGKIGLSICYDVRFPHLYHSLAQAGAMVLTVPSAFSPVTGEAHWHALLRARAIETGCYVLAPAQAGRHAAARGKERRTYGHSLAVSPWGEILAEAATDPGIHIFDIDASSVHDARRKVPALKHVRAFDGPS